MPADLMSTTLASPHRWYDPAGPTAPDRPARQVRTLLSGALPGLEQLAVDS